MEIVKSLVVHPRFRQLELHLNASEYAELKKKYDEIKKRENIHNERVNTFMSTIEEKIASAIFSKEAECEITHTDIKSWFSQKETPQYYFMKEILNNFTEASTGNSRDFVVRETGTNSGYYHLVSGNGGKEVASAEKSVLECLKMKLDRIKPQIVKELAELNNEANAINELFDGDFKSAVRLLIIEIEDNGRMKGGCGLPYCQEKKT